MNHGHSRPRPCLSSASLTAEVKIADDYTLKSISAYRDGRTDTLIDFDNTPGPVLDVPAFYKDWQFAQEVQLLVEKERLQGVFGVYYLNGRATGAFDTVAGNVDFTIYTDGNVKTESIAAFGDVSYDLTDRVQLSAGLRWTKDNKTGTVLRTQYLSIRSPAFGNPDALYLDTRSDYTNSRSFEKFTPRISLSFQPVDDVNLYASWGRGFKSGGFDMRGDVKSTPATVDGYRPESIDSYEAGLKGLPRPHAVPERGRLLFALQGSASDDPGADDDTGGHCLLRRQCRQGHHLWCRGRASRRAVA